MAMSKKNIKRAQEGEKDWERIDQAVFGSEHFIEKYSKQLILGVGVLILAICAYLAYQRFYVQPKTEEAQAAIYKGEQYFLQQQDSLAIYGDPNDYIGFKKIISEYGSTNVANLAKAYMGLSLVRMHKYDEAITYLKDYSGNDKMLQYLIKGSIGDCLVNANKLTDAIPYFMDAAKGLDTPLLSPSYYKKAGFIYRELKNQDKVIEIFTTIKTQYMNSPEAMDAQKYIDEAQILKSGK